MRDPAANPCFEQQGLVAADRMHVQGAHQHGLWVSGLRQRAGADEWHRVKNVRLGAFE